MEVNDLSSVERLFSIFPENIGYYSLEEKQPLEYCKYKLKECDTKFILEERLLFWYGIISWYKITM